jgi:hypothetical protein
MNLQEVVHFMMEFEPRVKEKTQVRLLKERLSVYVVPEQIQFHAHKPAKPYFTTQKYALNWTEFSDGAAFFWCAYVSELDTLLVVLS